MTRPQEKTIGWFVIPGHHFGANVAVRLQRNGAKGQEPCGKDITPADGNGCSGGPSVVEVCGQNGMLYDGIYPNV